MDVRLPDGTIIRGVPDGMSKAELAAKLKANGYNLEPVTDVEARPQETPQERPAARVAPKARPEPLSAAQRFLQGLRDPFDAAEQMAVRANRFLVDKGVPLARPLPADAGQDAAARQARAAAGAPEGIDWARLLGNVASPPNLALMAVPGGGFAKSAAVGAGSGVLSPVADPNRDDFLAQKAAQATLGAASGAAGNAVFRGVARAMSPNASRNPDLALLRREGAEPTIGQALGGRANAVEEMAGSIPILGDGISIARNRARESVNRAAINRATDQIGAPRVRQAGQAGVDEAHRAFDRAYSGARALGPVNLDRTAAQEIAAARRRANRLGPDQQRAFDNLWEDVRTLIGPRGTISDYKAATSMIGRDAANFRGSPQPLDRQLGDILGDLNDAFRGAASRSNAPAAQAFARADRGFGNLALVEDAATRARNADGVFTPAQLLDAVRVADKSTRKNMTARGLARMQDLGTAAQNVIGNKVPNSGTADRTMLAALTAGFFDPTYMAAILAGRVAYTPGVQRRLVAMVADRSPGWMRAAEVLRRMGDRAAAPAALPAAGATGGLFFDEEE